ncbi:CHAT domain-containing protein, partial [Leptolyngbya sp. FACHB-36]|uniref:CHAT domain-containing protein n=1 Tax=Leptolyngbya sp. FACHB-36 TaxID=2692808 RepID=UPI00168146E1
DIAYQWQWQLGRLLAVQGDSRASVKTVVPVSRQPYGSAIAAYTDAFNTLQSLRSDLVAINPDVQFSFRESVEPLYRQFVELLLRSAPGSEPSQNNLKQARQVIESLQLAELDNFFREACLDARPVQVDQIDTQAAIVYPIILPNQFAVILSLPNQPLSYYQTALSQAETERILAQMQQSLRETAFPEERLPIARQVYDLLVRPLEAKLTASEVKTLVFVLDGSLRNLPMAALHDGQRYLVETYRVALAPGLQLLQPQPLKRQPLTGLLGGLSQSRQGFPALPNVELEVSQIKSTLPTQVLLDQTFTNTTFQSKIDTTSFPIVHLATHGQFSSNVDETFVLTWDDRITVKQLDQLLQTREGNQRPIELLVLSACETAAGDQRAALGMAGFAVRSGARSTLATLWSVNDRSTALLMVEFYRAIEKAGVTKAEALRRAQLALLKQPEYENPYYWAPFVLLGNWL